MFYLLCRICCMFRIGPFPPLRALRQVSHSPESGRLISSFSPAGIFFPTRAQRPSRALFLVWATVYYLFCTNQAFKLRRIHSIFVHYVSKRLSTLFPTPERGVPPRLSPHQKKARDSLRCPVPFSLFAQINIPRPSRGYFLDGRSPMFPATPHAALVRSDICIGLLPAARKRA